MLRWLLCLLWSCFVCADRLLAAPPHIVIFVADDLGLEDCSIYGGREVPTPNMERLAKRGQLFQHAFVVSPSCAPSRAALLTGLDPIRNGAMINHSKPDPKFKRWPAYFQELGYEVVSFGKVAHYNHTPEYGFDHASHFTYHADECVNEAVKYLEQRKSAKPLCFMVGTHWPHVPWPTENPITVQGVPAKLADTPETRTARGRYLQAVANCDRDLGLIMDAATKYLGEDCVFAFTSDHGSQFPFRKWNCYDAGIRTPLIISWPSKIKASSTNTALVNWTDLLPTMLEAAGGRAPADISGRSLWPLLQGKTKLHREFIITTHSADGKMNQYPIRAIRNQQYKLILNLMPEAEHHTHVDGGKAGADGRSYFDSWVKQSATDPSIAAVIKQYHHRPAEEFYDLDRDPQELRNAIHDPQYAEQIKLLRQELTKWMQTYQDQGRTTEEQLQKSINLPKSSTQLEPIECVQ